MEYRLEDLIDIALLQDLQDKLNRIYSFPSAIIDNEGKILTAVAWQDVCTKFHRKHSICEKECIKSDQYIREHLHEANPAVSYQCPHGLIDNALPIKIDGQHLGIFFTGQFFLEKPDIEFFISQARKYDFDEKAYLEAVEKVPIWSKEKLDKYLDFITGFIEIIAGIGLKQLKEIEANKALKENEEKFSKVFNINPSACGLTDLNSGKYVEVNEAFYTLFGFDKNEVIGKTPTELGIISHDAINAILEKVDSKGNTRNVEAELKTKNGELKHVLLSSENIDLFDKKLRFTIVHDITERKIAEEQQRESKQIIEGIIHAIPSRVFWKDENLKFLGCNLAFANDAGFSDPKDIIGKDDFQMVWHNEAEMYRNDDIQVMKSVCPKLNIEEPQTIADGKIATVLTSKIPLKNSKGEVAGVLGTYMDITERKQAKQVLQESEERFREIIELSWDIHYRQNAITNELDYMSPAITRVLGYELDEVLSMKVEDHFKLFHPDDLPQLLGFMNDLVASDEKGNRKTEKMFRMLHKSGEVRWINGSYFLTRDMNGEPKFVVGVLKDITTRKQGEEDLRKSEEQLKAIFENSINPIMIADDAGNYLKVNEAAAKMFAYPVEKLLQMNVGDLQTIISPDAASRYQEYLSKGYEIGEFDFVRPDKSRAIAQYHAVRVRENFNLSILSDITQRKHAEEEVKQSQVLSETIIDSIPGTFYMIDASGKYCGWNAYQRDEIVGQAESQMVGVYAIDTLHPDDREIIGSKIANVLMNGVEEVVEGRVLLRGGPNYRWFLLTGCRMMIDGSPVLIGTGIDITERKHAESILKDIIDKNPMSIQIVDTEGFTLKVNSSHTELFGAVPPPDFSIFNDLQSKSPELEKLIMLAKRGEVVHFPDYYYNVHDISPKFPDKPVWIHAILFPLKDSNGKYDRFVLMHENITWRKQAEEAIKENEQKFRNILENSPFQIWAFDGEIYNYVNKSYIDFTGIDSNKTLTLDAWTDYVHSDDLEAAQKTWMKALENKTEHDNYFRLRNKYGQYCDFWCHAVPIYDENGNFKHFQGFNIDITESRLAEANLKKLNRTYSVLSNINHAIIRSHDKQELFDKVCQIAVDDGKYLMSWIGIINPKTNKVDVVASAGKTGVYLMDINIDLNNLVQSSGPTGQAIKSGIRVFS
ncbi:MAG: PAS domain S-box protein, partial [Bacteroidales bacterium]